MKKGKLLFSLDQLFPDIVSPFFVTFEPGFQKIREEKQSQDKKDDKKLDKDDDPELLSDGHITETVVVKKE
jgi:glyoxylase-like metal-dependent hydrolase (beta-lactamase superfamily II)